MPTRGIRSIEPEHDGAGEHIRQQAGVLAAQMPASAAAPSAAEHGWTRPRSSMAINRPSTTTVIVMTSLKKPRGASTKLASPD
jgi:hypothetical protein